MAQFAVCKTTFLFRQDLYGGRRPEVSTEWLCDVSGCMLSWTCRKFAGRSQRLQFHDVWQWQRRLRQQLCSKLQRRLVVHWLSFVQSQRSVPRWSAWELRWRSRVENLAWLPLLTEVYWDEDATGHLERASASHQLQQLYDSDERYCNQSII